MKLHTHLLGNNKTELILNSFKIFIIFFISISLLGNFYPFYNGVDSYLYGISAIHLSEGSWGFTNELLQETGSIDFVPVQWVKTIYNTAVPVGGPGIYAISTASFLIGGYYGLFYLGPIFTILLLIFSERIATNLFGKFVGLGTLILLSSNATIFFFGRQLLTDNIFALFLILGCFFLAKFFQCKKEKLILFSSIFFVLCASMKLIGLIFLPIEISLISIYFLILIIRQPKYELSLKKNSLIRQFSHKIKSKKFLKGCIFVSLPWLTFILFILYYNAYYFGDQFTDYVEEMPSAPGFERDDRLSIFNLDADRFEWIKFYAVPGIPDVILPNSLKSNLQTGVHERVSDDQTKNWVGLLSMFTLIIALAVSLYYKNKRAEIFIFIFFIIGIWFVYSSSYLNIVKYEESYTWLSTRDRYVIPAIPLSFILIGFILQQIWRRTLDRISLNQSKIISKSFKAVFFTSVIIFSILSLNESLPVQAVTNSGFNFNNPGDYKLFHQKGIWPDEQLTKHSVIVSVLGAKIVDSGSIPFNPLWGYYPIDRYGWKPELLPQEPIQRLKNMITKQHEIDEELKVTGAIDHKHDILVQKIQILHDTRYYRYLENEHGLILKDFSKSFCKMELKESLNEEENIDSDKICYND